jgi:hypothetical protein
MMQVFEEKLGANVVTAIWLMIFAAPLFIALLAAIRRVRQRGLAETLKPMRKGWRTLVMLAAVLAGFILLVYATSFLPGKGQAQPAFIVVPFGVGLVAVLTLLPVATFLLLFTTVGNAWDKWQRNRPARQCFRFGVRSLLTAVTALGVVLGLLRFVVPSHDPFIMFLVWMGLSLPLSLTMLMIRYALDGIAERRLRRGVQQPVISLDEAAEPSAPGWSLRHSQPRGHEFISLKAKPTRTTTNSERCK